MWQMMKADIQYNRTMFLALCSIFFVFNLLNATLGGIIEHVSRAMLVSVGVIGIFVGSEEVKNKTCRFFAGLPVSIRGLGIHRYSTFTLYWLGLVILLTLGSLAERKGSLQPEYFWWLLSKTGLIYILVAGMGIPQDLKFCFLQRNSSFLLRFISVLAAIVASFLYWFIALPGQYHDPVTKIFSNIFLTPINSLGIFFLAFSLLFLNVYVFERRKSYIE